MNRLKLLAAVALLGIPLAACEEATPPPPVGSIVGTVSIEGTGVDGVSVNLSNGNSTTTSGGGSYRFDNVEGGAYTVTISGFPSDATFDATSAAATISSAGQSVTVNFTGAYIRTASVMGTVTVENMGLPGVTVTLAGVSGATAVTDDGGAYAFTGLRMGNYSVEISGFDSDEVGFSATAASVTVGVGESKIVSFDGTYLRTAGIMGRVSVEGEGLEGVTVSLSGGPDAADMTTETDAAGQYSFAKLRAGDYAVGISGYNTDDYEFEVTSQNVTVALGETANVPFEGVLLRTSGVSGRVSVEGIGLADVMVTLSMADAEDATAMTDAGGLYAFSGLAAGDYTVAIALSDEQMAAYVFEMTSMDVTVGDDETQIVNFEAEHAATASVTVQLFVDEGANGRNDMMDEGEGTFPTADMLMMVAELGLPLALPITLAGPGVHDTQDGMAMPDGSVVFSGLKAGQYQVIVTDIPAEVLAGLPPALGAVLRDYSYGGPATGYPIALTVGQAATQHAPVDITHTTVHFGVTLKNGETRGMPLPGAMVTLYADAMGETKVGEGMTMVDEETMHAAASIRIAREGTSGNMVHAGVSADSAYTVADGMTAVMWDPQKTYTMGANDNDIVNLNVDVTFGGATITTEYGGGDALAGWAVSVAHGDTMYADTLDTDGMAAFKMTVDSAGALPAMYSFSVDTIQDNKLDGGEDFEGTSVDYVHTGLTLAGTMDAGTMEVNYTTQSLVVGAHHERDQVMGFTGNVLDGDVRDDGTVSLAIRYIDGSGRSRSFTAKEWNPKGNISTKDGVTTFSGLPADENIIVQASVAEDAGVMLLDPDELAAYTGTEANGITGGHFGAHGGYSHTVSLCPLQDENPQDHGECSSFAYVTTHTVAGLVWKNSVSRKGDDFEEAEKPTFVDGVSVSLDPVDGKNLAGEAQAFTTLKKNDAKSDHPNDTHHFQFSDVAAGAYKLTIPDGWRARKGDGVVVNDSVNEIKGATAMLGNALNPLADDLGIDVTPATKTVYGRISASDGFSLDSVEVTVNGVTAMTDALGRYIAEGVSPETRKIGTVTHTNMIFVKATRDGRQAADSIIGFAANTLERVDLTLAGVSKTATVSGTVTASGTGAGVAGVEIKVDGAAPENKATSGTNKGKLVTGADGSFTAIIPAKDLGATSNLTATKKGMSFSPDPFPVAAHTGANTSGINFTGYLHASISGRVVGVGGGPMAGVAVTATGDAGSDADTTGVTGTFSLSVPFGSYMIAASAANVTFKYPTTGQTVNVGPGQSLNYGDIQTLTFAAVGVKATRILVPVDVDGDAATNDTIMTYGNIRVTWSADSTAVPDGYANASYVVQHNATGTFADVTEVGTSDSLRVAQFAAPAEGDSVFMVRVVATAADADPGTDPALENEVRNTDASVAAVDAAATGTMAVMDVTTDTTVTDTISITWGATTNDRSDFRVAVQVTVASLQGSTVWVTPSVGTPTDPTNSTRAWTYDFGENNADITTGWTIALPGGNGATVVITTAELQAASMARVDSSQGTVSADNPWKAGTAVAVTAKPAG